MDENPCYGKLSKMPAYKLRQVMNYLQLNGLLTVTNDEFAIVKLTEKSREFMQSGGTLTMKMAKEQEKPQKDKKEKAGSKRKGLAAGLASGEFTEAEETLFDRLRALRMEIAREEKVPPYIVFSDKTLVHMCFVKPKTKTEMLGVTGVGEFKFEKYGERFLACLSSADEGVEP